MRRPTKSLEQLLSRCEYRQARSSHASPDIANDLHPIIGAAFKFHRDKFSLPFFPPPFDRNLTEKPWLTLIENTLRVVTSYTPAIKQQPEKTDATRTKGQSVVVRLAFTMPVPVRDSITTWRQHRHDGLATLLDLVSRLQPDLVLPHEATATLLLRQTMDQIGPDHTSSYGQ
ncbi:hypothetical protein PVAR5_1146 [Paecilomyces variotii No. 5]|uniref:Uncharacterized protein n=1 Tax=Byssochlamys spectabilis (strain No. 5 / NBRC 109023) TaxID=1356009 RepID=V5FL54_BYSSN|nr:hypothetical protein PVAR5_1146 [Paecilomyces variotii No. 5]